MANRPTEAVERADDDHVEPAGLHLGHEPIEGRPLLLGAGDALVHGVELYVPLTGLVEDLAAEVRRLEREQAKVEQEYRGVAAKLANPQFTDKAPEDVIAEVRAKEAQLGERWAALGRSLERLREMEA